MNKDSLDDTALAWAETPGGLLPSEGAEEVVATVVPDEAVVASASPDEATDLPAAEATPDAQIVDAADSAGAASEPDREDGEPAGVDLPASIYLPVSIDPPVSIDAPMGLDPPTLSGAEETVFVDAMQEDLEAPLSIPSEPTGLVEASTDTMPAEVEFTEFSNHEQQPAPDQGLPVVDAFELVTAAEQPAVEATVAEDADVHVERSEPDIGFALAQAVDPVTDPLPSPESVEPPHELDWLVSRIAEAAAAHEHRAQYEEQREWAASAAVAEDEAEFEPAASLESPAHHPAEPTIEAPQVDGSSPAPELEALFTSPAPPLTDARIIEFSGLSPTTVQAPESYGERATPTVPPGLDLRTGLRRAGRVVAYAVGGYLVLVLALMVVYRFVNPPASTLMVYEGLFGAGARQTWVPLEKISPHLVRAVVVAEDGRFCDHHGIDFAAMEDAIEKAGDGIPRGASTISMQVTKNLFLWHSKSYIRKLFELPMTLVMEILLSKSRILEIYLNIAEWAPGVFGAEAAAQHHFNRSASSLTEREAAQLAASLPNPIRRDAGDPGPRVQRKASIIQSRARAAGEAAPCVSVRRAAAW